MAKLQLARILQEFADRLGGYNALSKEIRKADKRGPHPCTLKKICEGGDYTVSKRNLEAIHKFLRKHERPGLDTVRVFEPEGLLRSLVEKERITIYLPPLVQRVSQGEGDYRDYMSWWDFRAFSNIVESINELGAYVHVDIQSEPPRPPGTNLATIDWDKLLEADDRTYCAVGSPLVSGLSAYMLGKMFNVEQPFSPPVPGGKQLPFYFVWYPGDDSSDRGPYPNAFALSTNNLRNGHRRVSNELLQAIDDKQAQAFVFGNDVLDVWLQQERHDQYGVVVAQRRAPGSIWAVVAGLSGPGTFACADILPEIKVAVRDYAEGEVSPVTYAVVRSVIGKDARKQFGDARKVIERHFVEPTPDRWVPMR